MIRKDNLDHITKEHYNGEFRVMRKQEQDINSEAQNKDTKSELLEKKKSFTGPEIGVFAINITILLFVISLYRDIGSNESSINTLQSQIASINTEIANINKAFNGDDQNRGYNERLRDIEDILSLLPIKASIDTTVAMNSVSIEQNDIPATGCALSSDTILGTDADNVTYIAKDYVNDKIFLTYSDEGKEVYFLGQYNENYHWDGYCVTNAYNPDGTLYGICESNFLDGVRLDYKSFYQTDIPNEWVYANRVCEENTNTGENILYNLTYTDMKNFTSTNARVTDMFKVDTFIEKTTPKMLTYYSGNTKDEKFNDTTGNAFEITFREDGTVKLIYEGNFVDGLFEDSNAWDINYIETDQAYVHNTGSFSKGSCNSPSKTYTKIELIKEIVQDFKTKKDVRFDLNCKE